MFAGTQRPPSPAPPNGVAGLPPEPLIKSHWFFLAFVNLPIQILRWYRSFFPGIWPLMLARPERLVYLLLPRTQDLQKKINGQFVNFLLRVQFLHECNSYSLCNCMCASLYWQRQEDTAVFWVMRYDLTKTKAGFPPLHITSVSSMQIFQQKNGNDRFLSFHELYSSPSSVYGVGFPRTTFTQVPTFTQLFHSFIITSHLLSFSSAGSLKGL